MKNNIIIKIILSGLFFLCLIEMPYGFYQLVRMVALIGFCMLAYNSYNNGKVNITILYLGLALLFQPFIKISLGREIWNIVDIIVGGYLVTTLFYQSKYK
jgi:hypothetical protein